jgi:hypothetical protein
MPHSDAGGIILEWSHHILDIEDGIVTLLSKLPGAVHLFFLVPGDAYPSADLSTGDEY